MTVLDSKNTDLSSGSSIMATTAHTTCALPSVFLQFKGLSQEGVSAPGKNTRDVAKKGSYKHLK